MNLVVNKSKITGNVQIPGSKSHTIRAVAIASLAEGKSIIRKPLISSDALASVKAYRLLGAKIEMGEDWIVEGFGGYPQTPENVIDIGNSGTTLYIAMASAALGSGTSIFTGDEQIVKRPAAPLIGALNIMGSQVRSSRNNGMPPIIIDGRAFGGSIDLDGSKTSQYLSALLINCPLMDYPTQINVTNLVEKPFVEMTLDWISRCGVEVRNDNFEIFDIPSNQTYQSFDREIPADFSSAAFFMCQAAISGDEIIINGLDQNDIQGDKAITEMLKTMGADVEYCGDCLHVKGGNLKGIEIDLSDTPDALPALAVTACFAEGETRLVNVAQARLKETDRIAVMAKELSKMGADITELPDGLIISGSKLKAAEVDGNLDHRVIMALAVAGSNVDGITTITYADALNVTFPTFVELMNGLGADIASID